MIVTVKFMLLLSHLTCNVCAQSADLMVSPAQTPIEEFTPTPAFPALQYLESVDEGGVAWRAGLRMGDFLIEVRHIYSYKTSFSTGWSTVELI